MLCKDKTCKVGVRVLAWRLEVIIVRDLVGRTDRRITELADLCPQRGSQCGSSETSTSGEMIRAHTALNILVADVSETSTRASENDSVRILELHLLERTAIEIGDAFD